MTEPRIQENRVFAAVGRGDQEAFGLLVGRFQSLALAVAYNVVGDVQRAEDVAQQAFVLVWEKRNELSNIENFAAWLRAIVQNLARNEVRKSNRMRERGESDYESTPVDRATPSELAQQQETERLIWSTLDAIPEKYREPIILFYQQGRSVRDVAAAMELSESNIKQRLKRGREMLKLEMAGLVESGLEKFHPSPALIPAIMTAIQGVSTKAAVGSLAFSKISVGGASTASGMKSTLTTTGAGVGIGAGLFGAIGGLLGTILGIGGAWWGTSRAARQATSEEEKRFLWRFFAIVLLATQFVVLSALAILFFAPKSWLVPGLIIWGVLYSALLGGLIVFFVRRQNLLHARYGKPDWRKEDTDHSEEPLPQDTNKLAVRIGLLGSIWGCSLWMIIELARQGCWVGLALVAGGLVLQSAIIWRRIQQVDSRAAQRQFNFAHTSLTLFGLAAALWVLPLLNPKLFWGVGHWLGFVVLIIAVFFQYLAIRRTT